MEGFAGAAKPWTEVRLPHDAMIRRQRDAAFGSASGYFPGGVDEYVKRFDTPPGWRHRYIAVLFEGAYRNAMVYVNDVLAGQWAYGYSQFAVVISPFLRWGESNEIRVETTSGEDSRWYSGAGLFREVFLVVGGSAHIPLDGVRVTTLDADAELAVVEVATSIANHGLSSRKLSIRTELGELDSAGGGALAASDASMVTVLPGATTVVRQRLYVRSPRRWCVDEPSLYGATVSLLDGDEVVDEATVTTGIRTLQIDPIRGLRINGTAVKLRGACIHHDNGVIGAATIARAEERRVELLKAAGFNAIRSAHNPASRALLDASDRLGMLVMDETFDMWTKPKTQNDYTLHFAHWWERDVEAMVAKDYNHPCVIMYSIGNEIPDVGTALGGDLSRRLVEKVRSLDGTRLVTNGVNGILAVMDVVMEQISAAAANADDGASDGAGSGINTLMSNIGEMMNELGRSELVTSRTLEAIAALDVAGLNYMDARYESDGTAFPNRIIVGSETFPARIDILWSLVKANSHVIGDFTWTGWDYLGESGIGYVRYRDTPAGLAAPYPALTAGCADIDITGKRRPVSYYREIVFGLRTAPAIAVRTPARYGQKVESTPWSWSDSLDTWTWEGYEGKPVVVEVYADADEVVLLLDGTEIATSPIERFRAEFDVTYQPGTLTAVAHRDGAETGRSTLVTATGAVFLHARADRTVVSESDADLAFIEIELVDAAGTIFTGRNVEVSVSIDGPAELQGLGSASPITTESFLDDRHTTFEGRALAVVRPTGPGTVTVHVAAYSLGLDASVVIDVGRPHR